MVQNDRTSIITTHDLALGYHDKTIVTDINLTIREGEFIGILGANGSGKSTFLRALLGLMKPLRGHISVLGAVPYQGNIHIGYMPQMRSSLSSANLTSRAILEATFNGNEYGFPVFSNSKYLMIQKMLELVKATDYADKPFQQLSGGERQRIFLAQALIGNPKLLLLDEPLSNLDPHFQETFISLLHEIQQSLHATILFTAHDPNPLLNVMNRVLYFARGKTAIGTVHEIITTETLSSLYGIPIEVIHFKDRFFVLGEGLSPNLQETHHHA